MARHEWSMMTSAAASGECIAAFLHPISSGARPSSETSWPNSVTRASQIWMRAGLPCRCSLSPVQGPMSSPVPMASRWRGTTTTRFLKRRPTTRIDTVHQQAAFGRELAHGVITVVGGEDGPVRGDIDAMRAHGEIALAPGAQEIALPVIDNHRVLAATDQVDTVLLIVGNAGDVAMREALGQLLPALDHLVVSLDQTCGSPVASPSCRQGRLHGIGWRLRLADRAAGKVCQ
jgi:hypothetical protein